jgi:hypothetical protein
LERVAALDELMAEICCSYAAAWRGFEDMSDRDDGLWAEERIAEYEASIELLEADIEFCLTGTWRQ